MCIIFDRDMNICDLFIMLSIKQFCVLFIYFPQGMYEVNYIKTPVHSLRDVFIHREGIHAPWAVNL